MRAIPGSNRVKRGGNFNNNAQNTRSANRNNNSPGNRNNNVGVRLLSTGPVARWGGFTDLPPARPALSIGPHPAPALAAPKGR